MVWRLMVGFKVGLLVLRVVNRGLPQGLCLMVIELNVIKLKRLVPINSTFMYGTLFEFLGRDSYPWLY
jgi:hypothetical protein